MRSLSEEWQLEYPLLDESLRKLLSGKNRRIRVSTLSDDVLCDWMATVLVRIERDGDRLRSLAASLDTHKKTFDDVRVELAAMFYKVGAAGVQNDEAEKAQWASNLSYSLSPSEIHQSSYIYIHSGLWKALGIKQDDEPNPQ